MASQLYQALQTDRPEIRVLVLEANTDQSARIQCRLEAFCFFDMAKRKLNARPFEALSYTWGDASPLQDILVNGEVFRVTSNLESFLRERRESETDVDLWVDAICINQADSAEKNQQIPLMNMVYSFASKLVVWLGPATADSSLATEWLAELGRGSPYQKMPILRREVVAAIQRLLGHPWWTRAWIVQELVAGGMGTKISQLRVQCGQHSVQWMDIVIFAARVRAHQDDQRQNFPNVENILELDSLRDSAALFLFRRASLTTPYELLCRYRHFLATDRRDKIYAISDIFTKMPSQRLKPSYDAPVEDIYAAFARQIILATGDLDLLRHCGARRLDVPSWVPDWSVPLGWQPLPVKPLRRYFDVPWWANPAVERQAEEGCTVYRYSLHLHANDDAEAERQRQMRIKHLEAEAHGFREITNLEELPLDVLVRDMPVDEMEKLRLSLDRKEVSLFVEDQGGQPAELGGRKAVPLNAVEQGERITERRMKRWLLEELGAGEFETPYQSAGCTKPDITMDQSENAMVLGGVEWDTVEACHEAFVENVDSDWRDATRFMVAVGCCKALATANPAAVSHYGAPDDLMKAFWTTIFAGQIPGGDDSESSFLSGYMEWLPPLPTSWKATAPPVTATACGQVILTEMNEALKEVYGVSATADGKAMASDSAYQGRFILDEHQSRDGIEQEDRSEQTWTELAASWSQQPYDLYHRPFELLNMVPDPYWDTRKTDDSIARRNAHEIQMRPIISTFDADGETCEDGADDASARELASGITRILKDKVSMVPAGTLGRGLEKFALGRKFFITSKGHLGLGPKDTAVGDKVVVLFGSCVPFLLRGPNNAPQRPGWTVVGEGYVHGIMNGEAVEQLNAGAEEAKHFRLV